MRVTTSTLIWLVALLLLQACGQRQESVPATQSLPATAPMASALPVSSRVPKDEGDPALADGRSVDAAELAADQRLLDAQDYLRQAEVRALDRRQQALLACAPLVADERANCETSAEGSLEAELRAARVEFDARMMQDP